VAREGACCPDRQARVIIHQRRGLTLAGACNSGHALECQAGHLCPGGIFHPGGAVHGADRPNRLPDARRGAAGPRQLIHVQGDVGGAGG
jgi:hypothetical protein